MTPADRMKRWSAKLAHAHRMLRKAVADLMADDGRDTEPTPQPDRGGRTADRRAVRLANLELARAAQAERRRRAAAFTEALPFRGGDIRHNPDLDDVMQA